MDYKEKYENALEKAKKELRACGSLNCDAVRQIFRLFPELKESEDEKIRKELLKIAKESEDSFYMIMTPHKRKSLIAWLEKQANCIHIRKELFEHLKQSWYKEGFMDGKYSGTSFEYNGHTWGMCARDNGVEILIDGEIKAFISLEKSFIYPQSTFTPKSALEASKEEKINNQNCAKPADKVEPKFHKGEWIISKNKKSTYQVIEVKQGIYVIRDNADNHEYHIGIEECEKSGSLWNISDAKDGDVLATHLSPEGDWIGIYKKSVDILGFKTYCFLNGVGEFVVNSNRCRNHGTYGLYPATKEQCDLLFQKMKEAGYEWDAEKKELKKIEQEPTEKIKPKFKVGDIISNGKVVYRVDGITKNHIGQDCYFLVNVESEKNGTRYLIMCDPRGKVSHMGEITWLCEQVDKSFEKQREQKSTAWSEEDELNCNQAIYVCHQYQYVGVETWLKSLKERMKEE